MNQLRVLLYKEWRDQRVLMLGALVVCIVAIAIAKLLHGTHFDPLARARFVLPGCLGLFVLGLATEVITRDVQNRLELTMLRLPASRSSVWIAKIGFVTLAAGGFVAVLTLIEVLLRSMEHRTATDGLSVMLQPTWLLLIAAIGAACCACASVLRRSLPAAFLGMVFIAGLPLLAMGLPEGHAREWFDVLLCSWTPAALSAFACGAFLIGSFLAYRVRHPDVFGLRRAAGVAAGVGIVLVPMFAGTAHAQGWAFDITPYSRTAEIQFISPSPDGRFLAVQAMQFWRPPDRWIDLSDQSASPGQLLREEVWILDRSSGAWKEIDDRFRSLAGNGNEWNSDGQLLATSRPGAFGYGESVDEHIDPSTACVVSVPSDSEPEDPGPWYERRKLGGDTVLRWKAKGLELRLPGEALMRPSTQEGVVFHELNGFLVRHELEPDSTTKLAELHASRDSFVRVSFDGRYVFLVNGRTRHILDSHDGSMVYDCAGSGLAEWSRVPGRIGLLCGGRMEWTMLMEDGSLTTLPTHAMRCRELGRDRLLAYDQQRIECMKLDGSEREVLYQARP